MGLSPRRRGNHLGGHQGVLLQGSIPAQAGEPTRPGAGPAARRVYPRAGGGTGNAQEAAPTIPGLSPRRRGNHVRARGSEPSQGSIPAQAGEPNSALVTESAIRVYPRAGGGTPRAGLVVDRGQGLSPRRRGNPVVLGASAHLMGSIPAQAGEPTCSTGSRAIARVYPRAGGGTDDAGMRSLPIAQGLSPRRRGNRVGRVRLSAPRTRVYPRAGGGTVKALRTPMLTLGLSPRRRGNPLPTEVTHVAKEQGLSPRRRGNRPVSDDRTLSRSIRGLSPRRRGNQPASRKIRYVLFMGLSPRRRGNRFSEGLSRRPGVKGLSPRRRGNPGGTCSRAQFTASGSIPAQAGEP